MSDVLPFGRLWYGEPNAVSNAIGYAQFYSRSHDAVIRVYDMTGNVIETHICSLDKKSSRSSGLDLGPRYLEGSVDVLQLGICVDIAHDRFCRTPQARL